LLDGAKLHRQIVEHGVGQDPIDGRPPAGRDQRSELIGRHLRGQLLSSGLGIEQVRVAWIRPDASLDGAVEIIHIQSSECRSWRHR